MTAAKTMAEVLEKHTPVGDDVDGVPEDEIWCNSIECGFVMKRTIDYEEVRDFAAHQQDALTAAGFGLVVDAKAESLEEAATIVASEEHHQWAMDGKGFSGSQIVAQRMQVVGKVLRSRAAALRGQG